MKNFVLSIKIVLFDIEKDTNLLKMNLITFQKFIFFFFVSSLSPRPADNLM